MQIQNTDDEITASYGNHIADLTAHIPEGEWTFILMVKVEWEELN